jgi:hypothetical protein
MGYLDKSTITVDAILTKRGRELLAQGAANFNVAKFAIADDEVDYRLYNTAHPLGTAYYGNIIENMPVLEATPDETQTMRYKLVTLSGVTTGTVPLIPRITNIDDTLSLYFRTTGKNTATIIPQTTTGTDLGTKASESAYVITLSDASLATIQETTNPTSPVNFKSRGSVTATGSTFTITCNDISGTGTITIYGQDSGATKVITFTVDNTTTS